MRIRDVTITGSAAAGLFALGSSDFVFERTHVSDTRADGIHLTYGASGKFDHPVVERSGDDGVAVVSYLQDGILARRGDRLAHRLRDDLGPRDQRRGGSDIAYHDIRVERSSAAAVYLACEGDRRTRATPGGCP